LGDKELWRELRSHADARTKPTLGTRGRCARHTLRVSEHPRKAKPISWQTGDGFARERLAASLRTGPACETKPIVGHPGTVCTAHPTGSRAKQSQPRGGVSERPKADRTKQSQSERVSSVKPEDGTLPLQTSHFKLDTPSSYETKPKEAVGAVYGVPAGASYVAQPPPAGITTEGGGATWADLGFEISDLRFTISLCVTRDARV